jgi:hypothetical protein
VFTRTGQEASWVGGRGGSGDINVVPAMILSKYSLEIIHCIDLARGTKNYQKIKQLSQNSRRQSDNKILRVLY